jgi:hypothetical protein
MSFRFQLTHKLKAREATRQAWGGGALTLRAAINRHPFGEGEDF